MLQRILDLDDEVLAKYYPSTIEVIFAVGSAIAPDVVTRTLDYSTTASTTCTAPPNAP